MGEYVERGFNISEPFRAIGSNWQDSGMNLDLRTLIRIGFVIPIENPLPVCQKG